MAIGHRWLVPIVLAVFVAGCGSHGPTLDRSALPAVVLQPADVPRSERFDEGAQGQRDVRPGPRSDPNRFGRIGGWKARFRSIGSAKSGPLVVESRVDLFKSPGGAEDDLDAYKQELASAPAGSGAHAALLDPPEVGEQAVLARLTQGETVYFSVAWRRANATASVTASGIVGATTAADAVALARRQDVRLRRALKAG